VKWCLGVAHGKTAGSYVPLNGVGEGASGAVAACAAGRIEGRELATSGMALNKARPLNRKSKLKVTRAVIEEVFFFIRFIVYNSPGGPSYSLSPLAGGSYYFNRNRVKNGRMAAQNCQKAAES